jgi:hypothetical protein
MFYDSFNKSYKFLIHRIEFEKDENKKLKNSEDKTICVVCLEELDGKTIYCVSCNKYVGHQHCINQSLAFYPKCPHCNVLY